LAVEGKERGKMSRLQIKVEGRKLLPAYVIGCSLAEVCRRFGLFSDAASLQGVLLSSIKDIVKGRDLQCLL
jgi:hypothetical protein